MPISVQLRKVRGETVVRLSWPYDPPLEAWSATDCPLLSGVDPYGDTIFNRQQMQRLADEIRSLLPSASPEQRVTLTALALTCQRGQSPPHQYLWFIGD